MMYAKQFIALLTLVSLACSPISTDAADWQLDTVEGAGGVPIATADTGNRDGVPVVLLHGLSGSLYDWHHQLNSAALGDIARLIAVDLRGHGASGKPWAISDYESADFAEDLAAVMRAKKLCKPILVGWSYGGRVITSYVRHFGTGGLSGIIFVAGPISFDPKTQSALMRSPKGSKGRSKQPAADPVVTAAMHNSLDWARQVTERYVATPLDEVSRDIVLASHLATPRYVRRAIFANLRPVDELARAIVIPTAFIHGKKDVIIPVARSLANAAVLGTNAVIQYEGVGHSPPLEIPAQFNQDLVTSISRMQQQPCPSPG
ncbi:MAG: alpha/beta hydrolase [Pseudomonadota bacterium]